MVSVILPSVPLTAPCAYELRTLLNGKKYEKVNLLIHSGGGDISVAYQMIQMLRMHSNFVVAFIPLYAKSAATLFCLGVDEVVVDELAQLGPLDAQVFEQGKGGHVSYSSALNPFKTLEQLREFSLQTLDIAVKLIVARSGMTPADALGHATRLVGEITGPLFSQLSPEKLGEYSRALSVGVEYGKRLLKRYSKIPDENQRPLLEKLVHGYPSHDYIIDYHEAQDLGLPVRPFKDSERDLVNKLLACISEARDEISLIEPEEALVPEVEKEPSEEEQGGKECSKTVGQKS